LFQKLERKSVANHLTNKYWKLSKGLIYFLLVLLLISCSKPLIKGSGSDSSEVRVGAPVVEASYPVAAVPEPTLAPDPEPIEAPVSDTPEAEIVSASVPVVPIDSDIPEPEITAGPVQAESVVSDIPEAEIAPEPEPVAPSVVSVPGPEIVPEPVATELPAEIPLPQNVPEPLVPEPAEAPSIPVATTPVEPTLDLDKLGTRLRQTKAIGLFTKLELKSQVKDLLDEMEEYHESKSSMELEQLEEHFNLLVMKLLLLLQDDDPQLHKEIARSRPVLWNTLADPSQFSSMKGT
jgi:hypothetical protein